MKQDRLSRERIDEKNNWNKLDEHLSDGILIHMHFCSRKPCIFSKYQKLYKNYKKNPNSNKKTIKINLKYENNKNYHIHFKHFPTKKKPSHHQTQIRP